MCTLPHPGQVCEHAHNTHPCPYRAPRPSMFGRVCVCGNVHVHALPIVCACPPYVCGLPCACPCACVHARVHVCVCACACACPCADPTGLAPPVGAVPGGGRLRRGTTRQVPVRGAAVRGGARRLRASAGGWRCRKHTRARAHTCTNTHTHTCMHARTHAHTHTHTHTHTHNTPSPIPRL